MTETELIKNYDKAISSIAKKVAGKRIDMVDDLWQIGRITLLELYPKTQKWAYLSRAIKNEMTNHKIETSGPVSASRRTVGRGHIHTSEALPDTLATVDKDYSDLPQQLVILEEIEADIQALPYTQRRLAEAWIRQLEGHECRISSEAKKREAEALVGQLVEKYRDRYLKLMGDV